MKKTNPSTKLDELYSLRETFSVIGITGRSGSGCTDVARILAKDFKDLEITRPKEMSQIIQERKYEIVYNFSRSNWITYNTIEYKNVLILLLIQNVSHRAFSQHLKNYFRKSFSHETDEKYVSKLHKELYAVFKYHSPIIRKAKSFRSIDKLKREKKLKELAIFFWGDFKHFAEQIDTILVKYGILERIFLLHHTASNFRKSGQPFKSEVVEFKHIYHIAHVINRIIKGVKVSDNKKNAHVVIDSLRNSSEINFFKERYSGFYLVAVKSDDRKSRLLERYNDAQIVEGILKFDETEYKCNDFVKGRFFTPDVQNCIQKADYHIITNSKSSLETDFITLEQQLMKLQGLIQQPGLITPSTIERCMQFAFNAKLSSGCISRQVGAVITDSEYSVKSIGWNDVPRGAVPCVVRNAKDIVKDNPFGFSSFEKGFGLKESADGSFIIDPDHAEIDQESKDFNHYLKENFNDLRLRDKDLGGINCPYCFKTAYNTFKGEKNQVHTRSLHAEENAMLQIAKYGGQPLKDGILFTTASPCELCSKKAYQLGIKKIYYIDPYPGISRSHVLRQGIKSALIEETNTDPELFMFYGAIGRGFVKLYEPFLSQKDEIGILTDFVLETPFEKEVRQLKEILKKKSNNLNKLVDFFKDENTVVERILSFVEIENEKPLPQKK